MDRNLKVSIITTFYNSVKLGNFVHKAMGFLLAQTYQNIEFICVNDGSQDETLLHLRHYEKLDRRIIIIDKKNEGTAQYAKAAGQDAVTGDLAFTFDHDDEIPPNAIEDAVKVFEKYPTADMVDFTIKTILPDGKLKNFYCLDEGSGEYNYRDKMLTGMEALKKTVGYYHFNFRGLYRTELFKTESFRFTEKLMNADEIVERRLLHKANEIRSCPAIYYHYVYTNSSAKSFNLKKTDMVRTDEILREYFKELGIYKQREEIFERYAFHNLINGIKAYVHYRKSLFEEDNRFYYDRLLSGYKKINKKLALKHLKGAAKIYNTLLISNFNNLITFYSLKK